MNSTDPQHTARLDSERDKASEPQAAVDIEKQCAVPLPSGTQCARGLTCKRHSMAAKRAVPGETAPFDQLLATYVREKLIKPPGTNTAM